MEYYTHTIQNEVMLYSNSIGIKLSSVKIWRLLGSISVLYQVNFLPLLQLSTKSPYLKLVKIGLNSQSLILLFAGAGDVLKLVQNIIDVIYQSLCHFKAINLNPTLSFVLRMHTTEMSAEKHCVLYYSESSLYLAATACR